MIMSLLAVPIKLNRLIASFTQAGFHCLQKARLLAVPKLFCLLALIFLATAAFAQSSNKNNNNNNNNQTATQTIPTAQQILINLNDQIPAFKTLVNTIAFVIGLTFIISGLLRMKHFGEMRTMMSREHSMGAALIYLIVGAMLIYLPTTISVGTSTFWTTQSVISYPTSEEDPWTQFLDVCYNVVGFVGLIAFIRGLVLLAHAGEGGHQQGGLAKAATHLIGGLFCINLKLFMTTLSNTFGFGG